MREWAEVMTAPESFSTRGGRGRVGSRQGQRRLFSLCHGEGGGGGSVELRVSVMASGYSMMGW